MVVNGIGVKIFPAIENVYSSDSYLSMSYAGETKLLKFSIFRLYRIPTPPKVDASPIPASEVFTGRGEDYRGF